MPLQIPSQHGLWRLVFDGVVDGQAMMTCGFESGLAFNDIEDGANGVQNAFTHTSGPWQGFPNDATLVEVQMLYNTGTQLQRFVKTVGTTGPAGAIAQLPPNVALLIRKNTALAGRAHRGRFYQPFLEEASVDSDGFLSAAALAALQPRYQTFFDQLVAEGVNPRILHNDPALSPTVVTSFTVQSLVATQRGRLR